MVSLNRSLHSYNTTLWVDLYQLWNVPSLDKDLWSARVSLVCQSYYLTFLVPLCYITDIDRTDVFTHVKEPVLANGTMEVPTDFVKIIKDCRTGFTEWGQSFFKREQFGRTFLAKVMTRSCKGGRGWTVVLRQFSSRPQSSNLGSSCGTVRPGTYNEVRHGHKHTHTRANTHTHTHTHRHKHTLWHCTCH